jgi:hypothetical protein
MSSNSSELISFAGELCPCGKSNRTDLERVSRGALVKVFLFWLPLKKYKCYKCMRNRWVLDKAI